MHLIQCQINAAKITGTRELRAILRGPKYFNTRSQQRTCLSPKRMQCNLINVNNPFITYENARFLFLNY